MTRTILDLAKPKTTVFDLSNVLNPRVNDDLAKISFHIQYDDKPFNMTGYKMYFISADENMGYINVDGMVDKIEIGDNVGNGDVTFKFPPNVFKKAGTFDSAKTMFVVENVNSNYIQSTINVSLTVLENGTAKFNADVDQIGYDSKLEEIHNEYKNKAQNLIDELINQVQAVNNFNDVKETANQAKQVANDSIAKVNEVNNEVTTARSRFSNLNDRLNNQDIKINSAETTINANANYNRLAEKDSSQDIILSNKADKAEIENRLSQMKLYPEAFENADAIKQAYPDGKDGIFVAVDTGHQWYWVDGTWKDAGAYQSQGSKIIKSSDVFQSNINYDSISAWNNATFTTNSDGSITIDDSETYTDRGIIFSLENITKYFNIKIVTQNLDSSAHIDFWKYNPNNSNGLGIKVSDVTKDTNNPQMLSIPSDTDRVLLAVHGRGTLKIKVSANDDGLVTVDEYLNLFKGSIDVNNLVDSEVKGNSILLTEIGPFGNAIMTNYGSEVVFDVKANNAGFTTRQFTANSERVQIHVDGEFTQKGITVQVNYVDTTSGKSKYFKVANISGGKMKDLTFDASSLIIYQHADPDKFRLLIQSNIDSAEGNNPVGKITLRSLSIYNPNSEGVNNSLLYNYKLKKTLSNVIAKLDEFDSDISKLKTLSSNSYVTLPDGTKGRIIYANGQLIVKNSIYKRILLLGNSLLLGSSTDGSHGAPFGLTASSPTKDWAYLLTQKLQAKYSSSVTVNKLHDAVFEQSESDDNSQNYINNNFSKAEKNNDLVIIQIGDNVNSDLRRTTFKANFEKLINAIRSANPTADILIAGVWFDGAGLQNWLLDFANNHNCMFAPLHDLYRNDTIATVGDKITFADGTQMAVYEAIKTHPGDKGHALIADRIYSTLYPK